MSPHEPHPDNATAEDLAKSGVLREIEEDLKSEFDRSRNSETQAINDFEKMLWLTNSGAATVTIGFITTTENPTLILFIGSSAFVLGIIAMLVMRFVAETVTVRDRARRQKASESFFLENAPLSIFGKIRDDKFRKLSYLYKFLKSSAGILFVIGCILTLIGIFPNIGAIDAHNNQFNEGQATEENQGQVLQ